MTVKAKELAERPKGLLIDQKGIQEEFGLSTRDVIRWTMSGKTSFPRPVQIIGRTYLFDRAAIHRYFKLSDRQG